MQKEDETKGSPLVSVIIPTYNSDKTIIRALQSCLRQHFSGTLEVLIVDDNSSDRTLRVIQEFIETSKTKISIRVFLNNKNYGPAYSRNRGITLAEGDYIAFLDSDDFWGPEKLSLSIQFLENDKSVGLVGHGHLIANDAKEAYAKRLPLKQITTHHLLLKNPISTPTIVFRKNVNIYFDERMFFAEDHDFLLRFSLLSKIYQMNVPESAMTYLGRPPLSPGGLSSNKWKMRLGEMKMLTKFCLSNRRYFPLLPFLITLSLLKHVKGLLK